MSTYTFVENLEELKPWIKKEVIFKETSPIQRGARGKKARRVQEWLSYHGDNLEVDGDFGGVTESLVKSFQRNRLLPITGKVDKTTFDELVKPMVDVLRKPASQDLNFNEAILLHAQLHAGKHPVELGNTARIENRGPWVRLYMNGLEDKWCAGFAGFLMHQAAETSGRKMPFQTSFSVDSMSNNAANAGYRVSERDMVRGEIPEGSLFMIRHKNRPWDWTHIGVVTDSGEDLYHTIEGNANHNRSVNGFEVTSVTRGYANTDYIVFGADEPRVKRYFYDGPRSYTHGSFFKLWGGWATAKHVIDEIDETIPDFAQGPIEASPNFLDAALLGCTLPNEKPKKLTIGQNIIARGFPAGSRAIEERYGEVYMSRPEFADPDTGHVTGQQWIIQINFPDEPVVGGMSGGIAIDADSGEPVGIIVTSNGPANTDKSDDKLEHSLDIVSLRDVWEAFKTPVPTPFIVA